MGYHSDEEMRRNPFVVCYDPELCTGCSEDGCLLAHNKIEIMYHPLNYKTSLCKNYLRCPRGDVCAFAHGEDDLRKLQDVVWPPDGTIFSGNVSDAHISSMPVQL